MALVKRQNNSTRLLMIMAVVVVVGAVGFFLARQFFSSSGGPVLTNSTTGRTVITNFGETILNDSRYTDLQPYGSTINVNANTDAGQPQPFQ